MSDVMLEFCESFRTKLSWKSVDDLACDVADHAQLEVGIKACPVD